MVFDWDDHCNEWNAMSWMLRLKEMRPDFKATLFTIPGRCTAEFLADHPDWIELAVHGWRHDTVYECADWSADYLNLLLDEPIIRDHFVTGWKAPGWQISDGCYDALLKRGWWVADQHLEDARRPPELPVYLYEDGHYHGHVNDWGSNGLNEDWDNVIRAVTNAESFEFASEIAAPLDHHPEYSRA